MDTAYLLQCAALFVVAVSFLFLFVTGAAGLFCPRLLDLNSIDNF